MRLTTHSLSLSTILLTSAAALAQTVPYAIDPAHSEVDFSIKHMAISTVHGRFSVRSGTVNFDAADPTKSSVDAVIDVKSVSTGEPKRDAHLNSPDFFETAKYPTAEFKSSSVKKTGDGYDVYGDLTMHGVTKPVTLHLDEPSKEQIGMDGKPHRGFSATTQINRKDFGLVWNGNLKSGDNVLGDDIKMSFEVEAGKS